MFQDYHALVNKFEVSKLIKKSDIAVIKTEDDYPNCLLKLLKDPSKVEMSLKDDYNHEFPPCHRVVEGKLIKPGNL